MIVWISGPTGAGKSTLANSFCELGYSLVEERVPADIYRAFTSDPARYCFPLQEEIMRSRYEAWRALADGSRLVFDRSIDEDAQVFCRMHHELGLIDDHQYERLLRFNLQLQSGMPGPDVIVFVCPQLGVLGERVTAVTHAPIIVQNLELQLSLYSEWLATRREDILKLDNSACRLTTTQQLFQRASPC
jgi:deoxyadenosine/deoxycytidine kinase